MPITLTALSPVSVDGLIAEEGEQFDVQDEAQAKALIEAGAAIAKPEPKAKQKQ